MRVNLTATHNRPGLRWRKVLPMSDTSSTPLHGLIQRMNTGEAAARDELIRHAYERLRRLTRTMVQDFSRVRRWEEPDDVLHEALLRLLKALQAVPLNSSREFFRLAATQIRRELLDLVRHYYGPLGLGTNHASGEAPDGSGQERCTSTYDPCRLQAWEEFHEKVAALPEEECEVFGLLWYQGLTQAEAAALLGVSESTVKRHWLAARVRLGEFLGREKIGP
jgi:RNA polymerase sigma-70 factor (ECF subfamily)